MATRCCSHSKIVIVKSHNHKETQKINKELTERLDNLEKYCVSVEEMDSKFASLPAVLNNKLSDFKNKKNEKDDIIKSLKLQIKGKQSEIVRGSPTMFERLKKVTTFTLGINHKEVEEDTKSNKSKFNKCFRQVHQVQALKKNYEDRC